MATEAAATPTLRYEVKSVGPDTLLGNVRAWLRAHSAALRPHHPPRLVSSVYFDTPDLSAFQENLAGVAGRRKLRFRWYGEDDDEVVATLELKCKQAQVGWKVSERLAAPLGLRGRTWREVLRDVHHGVSPEGRRHLANAGAPSTLIRYRREYLVSADRRIRVTIDTDLESIDQRGVAAPRLDGPITRDRVMVLEVKGADEDRLEIARAMATWPLPVSRNSKYVRAIARG